MRICDKLNGYVLINFIGISGAALLGLQLSSCSDLAERVRKHTYPPTFHYISDEQLRSTMWRLAYHARELRELTTFPGETTADRSQVLRQLEGMEQAMVDLNRTGWPTNHPLVDANRSNLLRDIRMAQAAIQREPANFLLASSVPALIVTLHANRGAAPVFLAHLRNLLWPILTNCRTGIAELEACRPFSPV